jgi:hypothetical protein
MYARCAAGDKPVDDPVRSVAGTSDPVNAL